jgi:Domain of unknown function (DUF5655)
LPSRPPIRRRGPSRRINVRRKETEHTERAGRQLDRTAGTRAPALQFGVPGRQCYHCKQWIEEGEAHDCWTTTEAALTRDLSEDLQDAWERLRETAVSFGDQRVYASHHSIMFSRRSCYFFVRPKRSFLEVCVFLGRGLKSPQVRRVERSSKSKIVHFIRITHRDQVEAPFTDWLREAYELSDVLASESGRARAGSKPKATSATARKAKAAKKPITVRRSTRR